jgi:hypothetical protein
VTASELLSAAADRIRDLAAATTPGQWTARTETKRYAEGSLDYGYEGDVEVIDNGPKVIEGSEWSVCSADDARWVAALSPAVSAPLEAILREASGTCARALADGWTEERVVAEADDAMLSAFALARLLCPELEDQK